MKSAALIAILAVLLLSEPGISGNQSANAQFLEIPFSARSSGMGEVGVVLYDETGLTNNPAALAFSARESGSYLTFNPIQSPVLAEFIDDARSNLWSIQYQVPRTAFSVGLFRNGISYGKHTYTDETGSLLESYSPHEEAYNLVIGFCHDRSFDYALGATVKYIHSDLGPFGFPPSDDNTANAMAADFGAMIRMPFQLASARREATPEYAVWYSATLCVAITSVGPDFGYGSSGFTLYKDPLPTTFGWGLALELAGVKDIDKDSWRQWCLLVAGEIEIELPDENVTNYKLGIEAGILEAVFVRAGRLDLEREEEAINTVGFSVSLRGILNAIHGRHEAGPDRRLTTGEYLVRHFDLRCNAAFYLDNQEALRYDREVIGISIGLVP